MITICQVPFPQKDLSICIVGAETAAAVLDLTDPMQTSSPVSMIVGAIDSDIAATASHTTEMFGTPLLSDWALSATLSNKWMFPTFSRVLASSYSEAEAIAHFVFYHGWKSVGLLRVPTESSTSFGDHFVKIAGELGISVSTNVLWTSETEITHWAPSDPEYQAAVGESRTLLTRLRDSVFIMVFAMFRGDAEVILPLCEELGMLQQPFVIIGVRSWMFRPNALFQGFLFSLSLSLSCSSALPDLSRC